MLMKKNGLSSGDVKMFNAANVTADDFDGGDFGTLDIGGDGTEGETINAMVHGTIDKDGNVSVTDMNIMGMMDESKEPMDTNEEDMSEGEKTMKKIMKGGSEE